MITSSGPIAVFDSGLGGLTVCAEIERNFPNEDLLYLGDTARVPYGVKSPETVLRYAQEICDFLLRHQVKTIVVACNTVSAVALPQLKEQYSVPFLGVLEPGAEAALRKSRTGEIGVIGTEATIRSQTYSRALQSRQANVKVQSQACPLFVPLVEEGWVDHAVTHEISKVYLGKWRGSSIDTVILGCTHYPLLKNVVQETLGEDVSLVDSATETAEALKQLLFERNLLSPSSTLGKRCYFATDAPEKMQELAQRFLGHSLERVERVDLHESNRSSLF